MSKEGLGWVRSDLDAMGRLGELKSEFIEFPPIRISSLPPLRIEVAVHCRAYFLLIGDFTGHWHYTQLNPETGTENTCNP